jgi:hypothetical protein
LYHYHWFCFFNDYLSARLLWCPDQVTHTGFFHYDCEAVIPHMLHILVAHSYGRIYHRNPCSASYDNCTSCVGPWHINLQEPSRLVLFLEVYWLYVWSLLYGTINMRLTILKGWLRGLLIITCGRELMGRIYLYSKWWLVLHPIYDDTCIIYMSIV